MTDLPTYPLTPEGVTEALGALDKGGSEDVAHRLAELGVTGQLDNDCACPIAAYLLKVLPGVEYVQVGGSEAFIRGEVREDVGAGYIQPWDVTFNADLPDALAAFVEDFDQGMYPELIEPTEKVNTDA